MRGTRPFRAAVADLRRRNFGGLRRTTIVGVRRGYVSSQRFDDMTETLDAGNGDGVEHDLNVIDPGGGDIAQELGDLLVAAGEMGCFGVVMFLEGLDCVKPD